MKRPIGLILTTIVLGLIAFMQLLSSVGMVVTGFLSNRAVQPAVADDTTIYSPHVAGGFLFFFSLVMAIILALLAMWAIFTIVGLLRLRNWGRISVLIIGACLALFGGLLTLGAIFMVFAQSTLVPQASMPPNLPLHFMAFLFVMIALVYLFIAAIGVWWLIYFNRAAVKALFMRSAVDAYGQIIDPAYASLPLSNPGRFSHVPVAIVIIACLFLFSTVTCTLMAFMPVPSFLLGFILTGAGKCILYLVFALLSGFIGYGLLHLDNRARLVTLGFLCFGFLNMGLIFLPWYRSQYMLYNRQMMQLVQMPGMPATPVADTGYLYVVFGAVLVLIFNGVIFWSLQRHRDAFLRTPAPAVIG